MHTPHSESNTASGLDDHGSTQCTPFFLLMPSVTFVDSLYLPPPRIAARSMQTACALIRALDPKSGNLPGHSRRQMIAARQRSALPPVSARASRRRLGGPQPAAERWPGGSRWAGAVAVTAAVTEPTATPQDRFGHRGHGGRPWSSRAPAPRGSDSNTRQPPAGCLATRAGRALDTTRIGPAARA
jgi:hypothetical protein